MEKFQWSPTGVSWGGTYPEKLLEPQLNKKDRLDPVQTFYHFGLQFLHTSEPASALNSFIAIFSPVAWEYFALQPLIR